MAEEEKAKEEAAPADGETENAEAPTEEAAAERPAFSIRKGSRFRMGYRTGKVDSVRGGLDVPYEVRIIWEGEKYPQYLLYQNVKREYEAGNLELI